MGSKYPIWYRQPFKGAYVVSRFTALLVLIPAWTTYYSITKPRSSWTLKESVFIRIIRWFMPLNANCGLHPLSIDKTVEVPDHKLKESSFVWIEPADCDIIRGYAIDGKVKPVRIPGYVWPKGAKLDESEGLVGLFVHGGGYMMGNGQESFGELEIVRQLQRTSKIKHFLSVDYRLVHESSHPGQLIDAISGYQHILKANIDPSRIVVIGACAGGHLALMLTRYLYDHKLPMPIGMMVFSPMVDMMIDFEIKEDPSAKRPNTDIDLLATSHYACLRFLGDNPLSLLLTPLMSPNLAPKGTFNNYPKTFISVGDCDAFRRECEQLYDALHTDGVDVTLDMQKDAVHDFWGMGDLVPSAKARRQLAVASAEWVGQL